MKSVDSVTKYEIAEKEKILKFGIVLGGIDSLFAPIINVLMENSP